jgi:hypothetical protein
LNKTKIFGPFSLKKRNNRHATFFSTFEDVSNENFPIFGHFVASIREFFGRFFCLLKVTRRHVEVLALKQERFHDKLWDFPVN